MTKSNVLEYDITAAVNNSDIAGINILGTAPVSNFDNALRELMLEIGSAVTRHVAKAAGTYTAVKADHNQLWRATGAVTLNLTAAATLTTGWALYVKADGGAITIDPSGAETINGAATLAIPDGSGAFIVCTGTAFYANVQGAGNVAGPASSTNNAIALFNGTTGGVLKNSGVTIDASDNITVPGYIAGRSVASAGVAFKVGNDITINDLDIANTMGVIGVGNPSIGYIKFGTSGQFGFDGFKLVANNNMTIYGTLTVTG